MDRGKVFERLLVSSLAEILSHFVTRKSPRPGYAQRDFDQLWVDFLDLGRYYQVLRTLNKFKKTLVLSKMDRRKIFKPLLMSSLAEILTHLVARKLPRPGYAQRDFEQLWVDF